MKIVNIFFILLLAIFTIHASKIDVETGFDFNLDVLEYAFFADIDTILLVTSGGVYTTTDTLAMQIKEPIVIMAKPGLAAKPIFQHSDPDSGVLEIFRIHNDVVFEGVIFDGYNARRPMKYGLRVGHAEEGWRPPRVFAKEGLNVTFRDCDFRNIYPIGYENDSGGSGFYFLRPQLITDPVVKTGNILIENCTFRNLGDEAIRIAETEKYTVERAVDTLIVRNCTFKNISAECIRFYGDLDTSKTTVDAYVLVEHLTIDSSATRVGFFKNNRGTFFRDVMVTNSILPKQYRAERSDYVVQVQLDGSFASHIDTFNLIFNVPYHERISDSKGAVVDTNTIYGFDPLYTDPDNFDYSLAPNSPAYGKSYSGNALGDLRWADPSVSISDDLKTKLLPASFTLAQNYPNPFNPSTSIKFSLSKLAVVKLKVYNITGVHIATLVNAPRGAGNHEVVWNSEDNASGIYFYHLEVDGKISETKKMILLK